MEIREIKCVTRRREARARASEKERQEETEGGARILKYEQPSYIPLSTLTLAQTVPGESEQPVPASWSLG